MNREEHYDSEPKCQLGCKLFTGGERRHHKDCVYYPDSQSRLFDEMEEKLRHIVDNPKITFGFKGEHFDVINKHISKWDGAKYNHQTWTNIAKEIGWDALTAALWYFRNSTNEK